MAVSDYFIALREFIKKGSRLLIAVPLNILGEENG
jgi:hypothetical protein